MCKHLAGLEKRLGQPVSATNLKSQIMVSAVRKVRVRVSRVSC